jgi:predicted RecA/RadA family phage recombinase
MRKRDGGSVLERLGWKVGVVEARAGWLKKYRAVAITVAAAESASVFVRLEN